MKILSLNLANYTDHPCWPERRQIIEQWALSQSPATMLFQEDRFDESKESTQISFLGMGAQIANGIGYQYCHSVAQYYDPRTKDPIGFPTSCWEGTCVLFHRQNAYPIYSKLAFSTQSLIDHNQRIATHWSSHTLDVDLYNCHLSTDPKQNQEQIQSLLVWIAQSKKTSRQIVMGDFNREASEIDPIFEISGFSDVWKVKHPNLAGNTWPSHDPYKRIDVCFVNDAAIGDCEISLEFSKPVNGIFASDHLGLCLELTQ